MLEGIANNRLTQTGADFVLATMHDTLLPLMPPELRASLPHDWRRLRTIAGGQPARHWYEHFCPANHHRFNKDDPDDERCPICARDTRYKAGTNTIKTR